MALLYSHALSHFKTVFAVPPIVELLNLAVILPLMYAALSLQEQEHAALINAIQEMSYVVEHGLALRVILAVQLPIRVKLHFHHAHSDPLFVEGNIAFHQPPPAAIH